jgi:two-component system sensor histidine kinase MtrB
MAAKPRHVARARRSLLRRIALLFTMAVIVTALALSLSAYFIIRAAQERDAVDKALTQTRLNLLLADLKLPTNPTDTDYGKLIDAFQTRGDFNTLIEAGPDANDTYSSFFAMSAEAARGQITPELAAKVAEGHIGYQNLVIADVPTLVVGAPLRTEDWTIYFFYDQSARLADLARLRNVLLIAGAVLVVLGALAGYLLARDLVAPIRRASKAAAQMSEGDLGIRLPSGSDEFGTLAGSFNRMAENLQAKMQDLEAGQARERRFVADVTHELRTPVSALVGEASLLKSKLETASSAVPVEITRLTDMVSVDVGRLRQLVDDLLEISRLEAQAEETVIEPFSIPGFLEQMVRAHGWLDMVRIVASPSTPPESTGLVARADRRRVERIMVNLVENALRHGAPPVTLEIGSSGDSAGGHLVNIVVTDSGPGIHPDHLPYVFDRFYKADPSRSSSRGSGLGLAIARENARLLGGDLSVTNTSGGGARFVLALPADG